MKEHFSDIKHITLPDSWDTYKASLNKRFRKNIEYYWRRVNRDFNIKYEVVNKEQDVKPTLLRMVELHQKSIGGFDDAYKNMSIWVLLTSAAIKTSIERKDNIFDFLREMNHIRIIFAAKKGTITG